MSRPILIEVFSKPDCCLCDEAKEQIEKVLSDYPARLKVTNIETDADLIERFGEKIPVVFINGTQSFVYKVHPVTLRKKLDKILSENGVTEN